MLIVVGTLRSGTTTVAMLTSEVDEEDEETKKLLKISWKSSMLLTRVNNYFIMCWKF